MNDRTLVCPLAAALALTAVACAPGDDRSEVQKIIDDTGVTETVTVFSWWTEGGERAAFQAMIDTHKQHYPGAKVINATADYGDQARDELERKLMKAIPPDLFQANIGADQQKWVLFNDQNDADSKVEDVGFLADALGLYDVVHPDVIGAASYEGRLYGLGVNVHRINSLVYNVKIFDRCGVTVPVTLPELRAAAAALKACGVTPFALGNRWDWTLSLLVSEALFPALAGGDHYRGYWEGEGVAEDALLIQAVEEVIAWQENGWLNPDHANINWADATARLRCEDAPAIPACAQAQVAAMTVMGDWAKGALEDAGWTAGTDFDIVPFPPDADHDPTYVFTSDTFPLPKGAANRAGAIRLLATMISPEAQLAFNRKKGSIPARFDLDPSDFDEVQQRAMADFAVQTRAPALSGMVPPRDAFVDWAATLKEALADGDPEVAVRYLRNHYAELLP